MPDCKVTLIASAGLMIECGGKKVLIDPLHKEKTLSWSFVTTEAAERVYTSPEFADPDVIIVTHDHPDHYCREMMERELAAYPNAVFVSPFDAFPGQEVLMGGRMITDIAGIRFDFKRCVHDGKQFANVANYAVCMDFGGFTVMDVADTQTGDETLADWAAERDIDLAVVTFPWYVLSRGRREIDDVINPRAVAIMHLPFEEDDIYRYRIALLNQMREKPSERDVRPLLYPFQTETFS